MSSMSDKEILTMYESELEDLRNRIHETEEEFRRACGRVIDMNEKIQAIIDSIAIKAAREMMT